MHLREHQHIFRYPAFKDITGVTHLKIVSVDRQEEAVFELVSKLDGSLIDTILGCGLTRVPYG